MHAVGAFWAAMWSFGWPVDHITNSRFCFDRPGGDTIAAFSRYKWLVYNGEELILHCTLNLSLRLLLLVRLLRLLLSSHLRWKSAQV